jgi:ATP phosphoribosyltransferase regulatory subunit
MTTLPSDIRTLFAARSADLVDVAILQPADPFLDMAGEDLRRRIFLTESETGEQLCLRPEFTIPVCLDHIRTQSGTPRRYAYLGEVFRQRREGRAEFFQAGIEDLGDTDIASADARLIADAHTLLTLALPKTPLAVTLGDQSVFEAVLAALGLPRGWQKRLARAFGAPEQLAAALADLANPQRKRGLGQPAARLVAARDREALSAHIGQTMEVHGLAPSAGRTPDDIARRLIEKAELGAVRLSEEAFAALKQFLAIRVPLADATEALARFADEAELYLDTALDLFKARANAVGEQAIGGVTYDAGFGRPLDYYTGMVFEIAAPGAGQPLAGGGRYDRLLTLLGAKKPIPGVGFSVWLDRIEALRGGGQ